MSHAPANRSDSDDVIVYDDPRAVAVAELRSQFSDFSRNGRWGTCGGCPKDGYGKALPELCEYTARFDHQLDIDALVGRFKDEVSSLARAQEQAR